MNNLTMSAEEQPDTYPQPEDGWVCFHCGERFKKVGAAEDHFGARPGDGLACRIKAGDERGLVMDLRKAQKRTHELRDKVDSGGCTLAGPKRGDCSHFIGLPGHAMPGQHDGPDDTVDHYGKPNGWCWSCWKDKKIADERRKTLEGAVQACENQRQAFLSSEYATNQPGSSFSEIFACDSCIEAIRALTNESGEPGEAT